MELIAYLFAGTIAAFLFGVLWSVLDTLYRFRRMQLERSSQTLRPIEVDAKHTTTLIDQLRRIEVELGATRASMDAETRFRKSILLAQIVLGRLFLLETVFVSLQRWRFQSPLRIAWVIYHDYWLEARSLRYFHVFFHVSRIGAAKAAFTEEPRFDIRLRSDAARDESIKVLTSLTGDVLGHGHSRLTAGTAKSLIDTYCRDMIVARQEDCAVSFPDFPEGSGSGRGTQADGILNVFHVDALSRDGRFVERFRSTVNREFSEEMARGGATKESLFLVHLLSFLRRELEVMPLYKRRVLQDAREKRLVEAYRAFWSSAESVLVNDSGEWDRLMWQTNSLIKAFYAFAGRAEALSLRERANREIFRDYSQCADREEIERLLGSLPKPSATTSGLKPSLDTGLGCCFRETGFAGSDPWVWDMGVVLAPPGTPAAEAVGFERIVAWLLVVSVDHTSYDRVVGIARSGVIIAAIISLILKKPLCIAELDVSFDKQPLPSSLESLLIVDDCVQSGFSLSVAAMLNARNAIRTRGIQSLAMACYRDLDEQGGRNLRGALGPREIFQNLISCAEYTYEFSGPGLRPSVLNDRSLTVDADLLDGTHRALQERFHCVACNTKEEIGREIRTLCESEDFVKFDLLFDYPETLLRIAHYFARKFEAEGFDVVVGASPNTIPILTGIALLARHGPTTIRQPRFLFTSRSRTILMGAEELKAESRIAIFDLSYRSGTRVRFVQEECLKPIGHRAEKVFVLGRDSSSSAPVIEVEALLDIGRDDAA